MSDATPSSPVEVALAIPARDGKLLVARRGARAHLPDLWEFPGGKIAEGESPSAAARRELEEETGLVASELDPLVVVVHEYPDRTVRLHAYLAREPAGDLAMDGGRDWAWIVPAELGDLDMPAANEPIVRALRWRLR